MVRDDGTADSQTLRPAVLEGATTDPMNSPDGKWVVYVSTVGGNADIYLQRTTGQTAINLTKESPANESSSGR
jgi:Tol biopolymer transport system component